MVFPPILTEQIYFCPLCQAHTTTLLFSFCTCTKNPLVKKQADVISIYDNQILLLFELYFQHDSLRLAPSSLRGVAVASLVLCTSTTLNKRVSISQYGIVISYTLYTEFYTVSIGSFLLITTVQSYIKRTVTQNIKRLFLISAMI